MGVDARPAGYNRGGVLNRAALLALVMVTAACGTGDKAAGPKPRPGGGAPVERHLIYEKVIGEKGI
jgi:hypothetical protein